MASFKSIVVVLASCVFALSCGGSANTSNSQSRAVNSAVSNSAANTPERRLQSSAVDEVVDLYTENCMLCHKDTGKGGKMTMKGKTISPIDLTSERTKAKSDEKLMAEIKAGEPAEGMPAFKDKLSDEEIKSIIERIRKF